MSITDQLGDLPIGGLVVSLAKGIAQAQIELDRASMQIAAMMAGTADEDRIAIGRQTYSMLELGFTPTFYQFTETVLEVKISMSMTVRESDEAGAKVSHKAVSVDAAYSSKFQYTVEGSSRVQTKLLPVPPPAIFQDRVRDLMEGERAYRESLAGGGGS